MEIKKEKKKEREINFKQKKRREGRERFELQISHCCCDCCMLSAYLSVSLGLHAWGFSQRGFLSTKQERSSSSSSSSQQIETGGLVPSPPLLLLLDPTAARKHSPEVLLLLLPLQLLLLSGSKQALFIQVIYFPASLAAELAKPAEIGWIHFLLLLALLVCKFPRILSVVKGQQSLHCKFASCSYHFYVYFKFVNWAWFYLWLLACIWAQWEEVKFYRILVILDVS